MKIVTIYDEYLEKVLTNFQSYPNHGEGVLIYFDNDYYFIPLTSKTKTFQNNSPLEKSKYYVFSKQATGTLLIQNYIHCHPSLVRKSNHSKAISNQLKELFDNKIEIEKKMKIQKNHQEQGKLHARKENVYSTFLYRTNKSKKIMFAKKYMDRAINSMASIEKISDYEEKTREVLTCKVLSRTIEILEIETITRLKHAWSNLKNNLLDKKLTLEYIIQLNEIVAAHQALEVGNLRKKVNYVSGTFRIDPPKKINIVSKLEKLHIRKDSKILQLALEIFYSIIVHQWFFDGNKRTAFLVLNKILIENNFGILLIEDSNREEFETKLYNCYKVTYTPPVDQKLKIEAQNEFFKFLKDKCFIKES